MIATLKTSLKETLLEVAKKLFWKYGIRPVSIEEICKQAGVSKMTFYRNFKNKEAIASSVLERIHMGYFNKYCSIMDAKIPFNKKVIALIQLEHYEVRGISRAFIEDVYRINPLKQLITSHQEKVQNELIVVFNQAQKNGDIRADIKMDFIFYMLKDLNKKMMDKELQKLYQSEEEIAMELTHFFFYGIFTKQVQ